MNWGREIAEKCFFNQCDIMVVILWSSASRRICMWAKSDFRDELCERKPVCVCVLSMLDSRGHSV